MRRFALAAIAFAAFAHADDEGHLLSMWRIDGISNRVYLLGSVHLLREQDYPIPSAIYSAYDDADTLIMEVDLDDLDPTTTQVLVNDLGLIKNGRTLADVMGAELYAEAERIAAEIDIPLSALAAAEPWLAAIRVEQLVLTRIGFDPKFGIEMHLAERAGRDDKEILGLEKIAEQLGFLDSLSLDAQRSLLLQSLTEAVELERIMEVLIDAWRRGDVAFLQTSVLADMQAHPELYDALVVRRNRNWAGQIAALLDDEEDYLIVVGALHLVGDQSLQSLLEQSGHDVVQMRQPY